MGKECRKCVAKYDDTWGVCLFCGSELQREEEARHVCALEETTPEEESAGRSFGRALIYIAVIVLLALWLLYLAIFASRDLWLRDLERMLNIFMS